MRVQTDTLTTNEVTIKKIGGTQKLRNNVVVDEGTAETERQTMFNVC